MPKLFPLNFLLVSLIFFSGSALAQLPRLSQFWLAPQLISPAAMSGSDHAQFTAHYSLQNSAEKGSSALIINGSLPFFYKKANRFGTAGLTLFHEKSAQQGLLAGKALLASYSNEVRLTAQQVLVGGLQLGYFNRGIDWRIKQTGANWKYSANSPHPSTAQADAEVRSGLMMMNAGVGYLFLNQAGEVRIAFNVGVRNLNEGSFNYLDGQIIETLPLGYTASVSALALQTASYDLNPMLLWQRQGYSENLSAGVLARMALRLGDVEDHHIGLGVFYNTTHATSILLQVVQSSFIVGVGYNLAMGQGNINARRGIETTIGWRVARKQTAAKFEH